MKIIINLLKFVLIAILTICIIAITTIQIISSTILQKNYIIQKMVQNNFYDKTYELVESNFENYIYQSGLDEEVLKNICTKEKVKQDINIIISNIYDGTNKKIDTTEISNNLNSNINKLGIKNSKNEEAIQQFVATICNEYTETVLHTQYEEKINNIYQKIIEKMQLINKIILIVTLIDIILILAINNKKVLKNIQDIGIALLSASIFKLIVYNTINSNINIDGIKIFNDAFSNTMISIIQEILYKIFSAGILALFIAIILIIISAIIISAQNNLELRRKEK